MVRVLQASKSCPIKRRIWSEGRSWQSKREVRCACVQGHHPRSIRSRTEFKKQPDEEKLAAFKGLLKGASVPLVGSKHGRHGG